MLPSASSSPFERIPGYEIQGKLGSGGMGVVYKALDQKLHRTVALKFVGEHLGGAEHRDRLLREARAASALDHPNIAAIHTIEELPDGRTFIVMGYYQGETLADKLRRGPLQAARAVNFALQIARGLQHAHAHGVVHRDVKPSNVMITDEGTAKILDFGLASSHGSAASTDTAALRGTLPYMSPEQLQNRAPDGRADIWSLGAVLYQCLTGRLPFFGESPGATLMAILTTPPPAIDGVGEDLQLIIFRALAKDPAARYQSCSELVRDLELVAVDDSHPTASMPPAEIQRQLRSAVQSASGTVQRPRATLWLTLALCLAVGLGLALLVSRLPGSMFGPAEKHIAVLPFEINSPNASTQSMADGLMETVSEKLSNLDAGRQSLWIVPSSEVRRQKIADPRTAARELGVTVAITGRLEQSGGGYRLVMDVIDAKSMRLLGSASIDPSLASESLVDDQAVERIASILHVGVRPGHPSEDAGAIASAYDSYLQGRGYLQRFDKPGNIDQAIALFQAVLKTDPKFALAYASIGEAYLDRFLLTHDATWLKQASDFCDRAVALKTNLPAVYITSARVHESSGNHELALQEFDRALALDPNSADAHLGRARVYESMGRLQDAEGEFKTAVDLRPQYWVGLSELGAFYLRHQREEEAKVAYRRVIDLVPDSASAHSNYGAVLSRSGDLAGAETELKKSLAISADNYYAYANLGLVYYRKKDWAQAARATEQALKINPNDYRVWANLGITYEKMGDTGKAASAYREELVHLQDFAKLAGDDPSVQLELAILYSKQRSRSDALRYLDAALIRTPNDPRALAEAGEVYENLGQRAKAIEYVRKSLKNGWTMTRLQENPGLAAVLSDPRFRP